MDEELDIVQKEFLGSGWAFPVTFSRGNNQLELTQYEDNINNSIDIIMKTYRGQRPFENQFGSGMQRFFFQKMNETMKGDIQQTVKSALLENEPRITVMDVTVEYTDMLNGLIEVRIDYIYNQTNTRHNYVYPFYVNEGTNLK